MATFVYLEKTDETVTPCREVGRFPAVPTRSASGGVSLMVSEAVRTEVGDQVIKTIWGRSSRWHRQVHRRTDRG